MKPQETTGVADDDSPAARHRNIWHAFAEQVARTPDIPAVEADGAKATYRELCAQACRLAGLLQAKGVRLNDPVAICSTRSIEMVAAVLAVLKAGAGYVPLDPAYPPERLAFMLSDARPTALLVHRALAPLLPAVEVPVILLDGPVYCTDQDTNSDSCAARSESLAYVLFTSGSTGRPKGVAMPHGPLGNLLQWHRCTLPLALGHRVLQFAPLSFDVSFQEIFTTLTEGGTLVLIKEELRRDPDGLMNFLIERDIQRLYLPFVALQQFAEASADGGKVPSALVDVITAGEQLQITTAIRAFFQRLPGVRLHNHYGPTETHVVTASTLSGDPTKWPNLPPIGRPIDRTTVHLLDDSRNPVAAGATGEIHLSGDCVARGYLNRPDITAERFLPDPIIQGQRMYRTGDLGRLRDNGEYEYLGRADDQVKIRGHRIELGEVEIALRKHPAIRECVVAAQTRFATNMLVGYVVPRGEAAPAPDELRSFLLASLPEPMVPTLFLTLTQLPLTPSGKVDRRGLPALPTDMFIQSTPRVPPNGDIECKIAGIWETVLGYKGIGATESFFAVGGTSLLMAQVHRLLQSALNRNVPIAVLFQFPTVGQLAGRLAETSPGPTARDATVGNRAARQREALSRQQMLRRPNPT